mgnify:CR=1 FL=1
MKSLLFIATLLVSATAAASAPLENLTLEQAIRIARENHSSLVVSQSALEVAEAQYQQAMAAFGPKVNFEAGVQRADQDRTFTFSGTVQTPDMSLSTPLGTIPVQGQPLPMNLDVKLFDRDVSQASLNFTYPLYTGGKEEAVKGIARRGADIAREDNRRTELELVRDVRKYYNGARFAEQMEQLAVDTAERFKALEDLTERLYQGASLKVRRTDYLRSRTSTSVARSMLSEARYGRSLSREALINAMGLPLNTSLSLAPEAPLPDFDGRLNELVADAMQFNPDRQRLALAIEAAAYKVDEARSGYLPTVGIEASTYKVWNGYDGGLFNSDNRDGWTIGIGLKWDIFDSGVVKAQVKEAVAGKSKLEAQQILLDKGLSLQIKDDFLRIQRARAQADDNLKAKTFAEENRKLNVRAYQEEMVETKDVIEAQIIESFTTANFYRARYDLLTAMADLDYRLGRALQNEQR